MFFMQIYDSAAAPAHNHTNTVLCSWVGTHFLVYSAEQQSNKKRFFLLNVKQRNQVVRAFCFDPKTSAHPRCLARQARLLFPLANSLSVSPFLFPPHSSGSSNYAQLSPDSQFIQRVFFGVCCSLFDLAALSTRQTVSTFNPPVCILHVWFRRVLALGFRWI